MTIKKKETKEHRFLLRIEKELFEKFEIQVKKEFRSVNGKISELIKKYILQKRLTD